MASVRFSTKRPLDDWLHLLSALVIGFSSPYMLGVPVGGGRGCREGCGSLDSFAIFWGDRGRLSRGGGIVLVAT